MDGRPTFLSQGKNGWTFHSGYQGNDTFQRVVRSIEQDVLVAFPCLHRFDPEHQFFHDLHFGCGELLVADKHRFGGKYFFDLSQPVHQQSRSGTYNITNALCKTDAWGYFYRSAYFMDFGVDLVSFQVIAQYFWVGGGNIFSLKIGDTGVIFSFWYRQG